MLNSAMSRRIKLAGRRGVRDARAVAERPRVRASLDAESGIDENPPAVVERQAELRQRRVGAHSGRPYERARQDALAVRQRYGVRLGRLERRPRVDLDAAP